MSVPSEVTAALARLDAYNSGAYNATTNPYGYVGTGGMDANWVQTCRDMAVTVNWVINAETWASTAETEAAAAAASAVETSGYADAASASAAEAAASAILAMAATLGPESELSVTSVATSGGVTVGTDLVVNGGVTINGDLAVSGDTTTVNTETVQVTDNTIILNNGEAGAGVTAGTSGVRVDRGTETDYRFVFDEATDTFRVGEVGSEQAVATREDSPTDTAIPRWNDTLKAFDTTPGPAIYTQASYQETDHGSVSGSAAISLANGEVQALTLTADTVITLPDPPAGRGYTLTLHLIQDTTGGWTPTFQDSGGTAVRWAYDIAPVWQTDAGARDVVVLMHGTAGLMGVHAGGWSS